MIRLIDDYVVVKESYDYMLARELKSIDKKTNKNKLKTIGYYGSLTKAIEACRKEYIGKPLEDADVTLSEALTILRQQDKRFRMMLEGLEVEE